MPRNLEELGVALGKALPRMGVHTCQSLEHHGATDTDQVRYHVILEALRGVGLNSLLSCLFLLLSFLLPCEPRLSFLQRSRRRLCDACACRARPLPAVFRGGKVLSRSTTTGWCVALLLAIPEVLQGIPQQPELRLRHAERKSLDILLLQVEDEVAQGSSQARCLQKLCLKVQEPMLLEELLQPEGLPSFLLGGLCGGLIRKRPRPHPQLLQLMPELAELRSPHT
mmetsp:Transcript_35756/g.76246  ORF Transcript_35756/g.76246 Transcript_35756/m.76246 type:complete len:225 (-) Transcript_35756:176-850(-)